MNLQETTTVAEFVTKNIKTDNVLKNTYRLLLWRWSKCKSGFQTKLKSRSGSPGYDLEQFSTPTSKSE